MKDNNSKNSKEKILKAAEDIFAQQGFDGARVDEIAKKAGVNKALIYYYFDSKEGVLDELFKINIKEALEMKNEMLSNISKVSIEEFCKVFDYSFEYAKNKDKFLKILITEALKKGEQDGSIYDLFYPAFEEIKPKLEKINIKIDDPIDMVLSNFFLGLLPVSMYIALADKVARHYGYEREQLDEKFSKIFKEFYIKPTIEFFSEKSQ